MNRETADVEKTAQEIDRFLTEWTDGYLMIGFHPITGRAIITARTIDQKSTIALNAILVQFLNNGGLMHRPNESS